MDSKNIEKKYQIFVSSTYEDLKKERQALVEAILESNNIPAGMELFNASSSSQWQIIEKWIDEADIVVLLVGERYGTVDEKTGKSFTHLEFDYATKLAKPLIVFKLSKNYIKQREINENADLVEQNEQAKFKEFTDLILKDRNSSLDIDSIDKLKLKVIRSLNNETINLEGGWIRCSDIDNLKVNSLSKKDYDLEFYNQIQGDLVNVHNILDEFVVNKTFIKNTSIEFLTDFIYRFKSTNPFDTFKENTLKKLFRDYIKSLTNIILLINDHKGEEHTNVTIFPNKDIIDEEENKDILKSFNDYLINSFAFEQVLMDKIYKHLYE
ncbi:DUF4062 domain-containing protein [Mammaliicoccus lentus]|uniref:DUF4062 domain-containing protein n=1 Tax=Mammaliicoccus lentus TaxID=42858 RepID=UPI003CF9E3F9